VGLVVLGAWAAATVVRPREPFATVCVEMPALMGGGEAGLPQANRLPDAYGGPSLFEVFDRPAVRLVRRRFAGPSGQRIAPWTLEAAVEPEAGSSRAVVVALGVRFYSEYFGHTGRMPQSNTECLVSCGFTGPYRTLAVRDDGRAAINECSGSKPGTRLIAVTYWGDFGCWVACVRSLADLGMLQQMRDADEYWPGLSSLVRPSSPGAGGPAR